MRTATHTFTLNTFFCKKFLQEAVYTLSESILDIERFKKIAPAGYVPNSNLAAIQYVYSLLKKSHQNEFFFKNTIFNHFVTDDKIKNGTYPSIQNEMPVAASITDLIVTEKGKSSEVLEIKSECDSFDRLASQLPDYYKVFRKVSLVTGEKLFKKAKERFGDTQLGLYVIDRNGALFKEREPVERYDLLDKREIFRSLRKTEYLKILNEHYDKLPAFKDSPETNYNDLCELFKRLDVQTITNHVDEVMAQRFYRVKDLIKVPYELRSIYYFGTLTRIERIRLLNFLEK